jgi:uncharacterized membrane protein
MGDRPAGNPWRPGPALSGGAPVAGICLIAFLIAVFPANVHAAKSGVTLGDRPVTPLWVRGPLQVVLILLLAWTITAPR